MVLSNSKLKRKRKEEAMASAAVLIPPQDTSPAAVAVTGTVALVSGSAEKPSTKKTKKRRILNKIEGEAVKAPSIKPADGEGKEEEERVVKDDDDGDAGLVSRKNEATLDGAKEQGIKLQKRKNKRKKTSGILEEGKSDPLEKSRKEEIEDDIVWAPTEEEVGKDQKRTKKSEKKSRKPKKPETEDSPAAGDPDEGFRLNATAEDNEEQDQNGTAAAERKLRVKPRWPLVDGKRVKPGSAPLAVANNVVEPSESKGNEGNGTAAAEEQLLNNPETDDGLKSGDKTAPEVTIEGVEDQKQKKKKKKKKKATDKWGKIIEPEAPVQEEDGRQFKSNEAEITTNETLMSDENSLLATSFDLKKVVVGGMPYYSTEDDIRDFFSECGTIEELDCMTFPDTGKFRGIGFITFKTEAAAERALALNGADMGGRFLKIELCKVKPKAESEKQVHHEAPKKVQGCTSAYIGNLAWDVTEADLRKFFKKCRIDAIRFALDKDSGEFRGFGHIDFADDESLEAAVKLDQQLVCGRPLKIAYSVPKRNQRDRSTEQLDHTKQPKTCFTCNEPGHMSYNCPKKELV